MSTHEHSNSPEASHVSLPKTENLQPATVDYVVQVLPVDNPHMLEALKHQCTYQVWKVLVDQNGQVVQVLALLSSSIIDHRYILN